jgi:hypothetical protein
MRFHQCGGLSYLFVNDKHWKLLFCERVANRMPMHPATCESWISWIITSSGTIRNVRVPQGLGSKSRSTPKTSNICDLHSLKNCVLGQLMCDLPETWSNHLDDDNNHLMSKARKISVEDSELNVQGERGMHKLWLSWKFPRQILSSCCNHVRHMEIDV